MAEEIKRCIDCNKKFTSNHHKQVRCPACQEIHNNEMRKIYNRSRPKLQRAPDPNECKRKETCRYAGQAGGIKICDYYTITGERRGCPVKGCTKYKRKPRNKKQEVRNG